MLAIRRQLILDAARPWNEGCSGTVTGKDYSLQEEISFAHQHLSGFQMHAYKSVREITQAAEKQPFLFRKVEHQKETTWISECHPHPSCLGIDEAEFKPSPTPGI